MDIKPEILSFEHSSFPTKRKERGIKDDDDDDRRRTRRTKDKVIIFGGSLVAGGVHAFGVEQVSLLL